MIKKVALGFVALIVVLALGGYYVWSNLDHIIKAEIEKYGTAATQAQVQLDSVQLSLASGSGSLTGLSVGNPHGYSPAKAMMLGSISVQLDPGSIRGNGPIVISKVVIDKPQVTYELTTSGDSNLQTIQRNTQAYASAMGNSNPPPNANAPASTPAGAPARKVVINDLVINNGEVAITTPAIGKMQGRSLSTSLPAIHLTNIGKASGGATAAQVAQQVLGSIANSASKAAVVDIAKEKLSGALKATPVSAIGGAAADTVGSSVKDIFGQ